MKADVYFWHPVAGLVAMKGVEYEPNARREQAFTDPWEPPVMLPAMATPIVKSWEVGVIGMTTDPCIDGQLGVLWAVVDGQVVDCMTSYLTATFRDELDREGAAFVSSGPFRVTSRKWKA